MSSSYDPTDDTANTILTGLLPILVVGLFNGFEDDKKKKFSFINIFDDIIIFGSIVVYPVITGAEWYQYFDKFNQIMFWICGIGITIAVICLYIIFLWKHYRNEKNLDGEEIDENEEKSRKEHLSIEIDDRGGINENEEKDETHDGGGINENEEKNRKENSSIEINEENKENEKKNNNNVRTIKVVWKWFWELINNRESLIYIIISILITSSYIGYCSLLTGDFDGVSFDHISNYCIQNFGFNKCKILNISNAVVFWFGAILIIYFSFKLLILRIKSNHFDKILKWLHIFIITVYPAIISGYLISTNSTTTKFAFGICSISFTRLVDHFADGPEKINTVISFYLNFDSTNNKGRIEKLTEEVEKLTKNIKKQMIEIKKEGKRKLSNEKIDLEDLTNEINRQIENMKKLKKVIKEHNTKKNI
ncbi:hypothetical protein C1645_820858 [Glomus cerebriforme]|uniref:Uncharacterized protein n=1 Tax=Glomus cerebriforme TaxID=658196 RepID=A0A397T1J7_9GLOM|nr:hypothetical protein C1645_820858 [Glomus cerebriforme]